MTDYRALLKKYMKHVGYEEGSHFIPWPCDGFTPDETAELQAIDDEIRPDGEYPGTQQEAKS